MATIERITTRPHQVPPPAPLGDQVRRFFLVYGILSSVLYVATDLVGGLRYEGYSFLSRTVSELSAIGAPSRPIVVPFFLAYALLAIALGFSVRASTARQRALRVTGALLVAYGFVCLLGPFVPMHMRGVEPTLTDTMHIVLTGVIVLVILLSIAFGASAAGRRFQLYSIATLVTVLVFGLLTGVEGPRIAANQPTPWVGLTERVTIYAWLLWVAVLALILLRRRAYGGRGRSVVGPPPTDRAREWLGVA